jgi:predicted NBD/HSP70 family sugar kinase
MFDQTNDNLGKNLSDVLKSNRSLLVKLLMMNGPCSRSDLAMISQLSQAAVTKIVNALINFDIVEEIGLGKGIKGRRTIKLRLKSEKFFVVAVKISRREFYTGCFDLSAKMYSTEVHPIHPEDTPIQVISRIERIIKEYCNNHNIIAAGFSVPGPYLREKGIIAKMTEFNGWEKVNLLDYFTSHLEIPVYIEHDANAGAIAEWWLGKNMSSSLVHIIASEGIGAGILINGKLLYGSDGIAGEIGHMSIDINGRSCQCAPYSRGCLEQYCSSLSFIRDIKEQLPVHTESILYNKTDITISDVFSAARNGDEFAISMIKKVGYYLGIGIANVVNIYNPDSIIISDIMTQAGDIMLESIRETVKRRILPEIYQNLTINYSTLQCDSTLYGAALVAIDGFLENPLAYIDKTGDKEDITD